MGQPGGRAASRDCREPAPHGATWTPASARAGVRRARLGHLERHAVALAQLLQLGDHAVGHARRALRVQAVHHARHQVDLRAAPPAVVDSPRRT